MGKSALLTDAVRVAGALGTRALVVSGADPTGEPWLRRTGCLVQSSPVGGFPGTDRLSDGNRLLHWLSDASESEPVLLLVDDADQMDEHSSTVLAFVGRRLASTRAGLLATATSGKSDLPRRGIPELLLEPLAAGEALHLLNSCSPDLAPQVALRVLENAEGNPLVITELTRVLTRRQQLGLDPLPTVLPLTEKLRAIYGPTVQALSPACRDMLVLAAAAWSGDLHALTASHKRSLGLASEGGAATSPPMLEAEQHGLIQVTGSDLPIQFQHPMWLNAVLDSASADGIRRAHQLLAAALDDQDRRMGHLASTIAGADVQVAGTMEQAAYRAAARGDARWAVDAMVRAAELSRTPSAKSARLAAAARLQASVPGDLNDAAALLADASGTGSTMSSAATSAQLLLAQGAQLEEIRRVLVGALESPDGIAEPDDPAMLAVFELLFYVCLLLARPEPWETYERLVRDRRPRMSPGLSVLMSILPDVTRTSAAALSRLDVAIDHLPNVVDASEIVKIGIAAFHVDRLADCRAALSQVAAVARAGRSRSVGVQAMLRLALDECMTGQLADSVLLADEGLQLSRELGHDELAWPFQLCLALVAALRGDLADVERLTGTMAAWAIRRGVLLVEHHCAHVRGLAAVGQQDFDAAYQHATSISPPGTISGTNPLSIWAALDVVEAAQRTGRHREAHAHATALAEAGIASLSPRLALRVAAAAAIVAPDSAAPELFEYALGLRQVDRWPFERARVELAYGELLHRLRQPSAAQTHLATAYDTFRRLQTRPWARRAAEQMRATGLPMPAEQRSSTVTLTGRDLEIATLAASGLSNQEIGARLFLSPRTVGSRLYRIFPKLGISSRAALRDALNALPPIDPA